MGRAIVNFSLRAAKNRARVRKSRILKKKKILHENHIREQIYSIKEAHFEEIGNHIDQETFANEDKNERIGDDIDQSVEFIDKLRYWAMHHRITHSAINDLLAILIFGGFTFLPRDSRTFMGTPTKVDITTVTNGKMWYYGVQKCLQITLSTIRHNVSATLDFSFDGLPIFKSSNLQFWPILFSIQGIFMVYTMHNCTCLLHLIIDTINVFFHFFHI